MATTRRDFLKYLGFGTAAAALAGCEGVVHKTIPYLIQPEAIVPGEASYYATCIANGQDFASVLVKTREGRPIFVGNNPEALAGKGTNARVLASVLGLYDEGRKHPNSEPAQWDKLNQETITALNKAKEEGKEIVLLSHSLASPSAYALLAAFKEKYPTFRLIECDAVTEHYALDAFEKLYGERALPDYNFGKASLIVSFAADFLGDWYAGDYEAGYAQGRIPNKENGMSRHIQIEAAMTITGAKADERIALAPSSQYIALAKLYSYLTGENVDVEYKLSATIDRRMQQLAQELKQAGSQAVVVTGMTSWQAHYITYCINEQLRSEAYSTATPVLTKQGNPQALYELTYLMRDNNVGVLLINELNPVFSSSMGKRFANELQEVPFTATFGLKPNETSVLTKYFVPTSHYLESWGDVVFKKHHYGLMQPVIRPLFGTRQWQDCMLQWMGSAQTYYDYIKTYWENNLLKGKRWEEALQNGTYVQEAATAALKPRQWVEEEGVATPLLRLTFVNTEIPAHKVELTLYSSVAMGDGQQASNPWLQELPDPISRISWDNYLSLSPSDAQRLGVRNWQDSNGALMADKVCITNPKDISVEVPVLIQQGQAVGSAAMALGYGRNIGLPAELQVGVNGYPFYEAEDQVLRVTIEKAEGTHTFACVQVQKDLAGKTDLLRRVSLNDFLNSPAEQWNPRPKIAANTKKTPSPHHFKLSIDLNACTGCAACVIACNAENNIPVVGKEEVAKQRDMHWLRIDRYEAEGENVGFQPMLCQHCENAPCENVCPVGATMHGAQGQNQMAYSRCVGTRYCANNCPYKVRRFNWFDYSQNNAFNYHMNNDIGRMVLNPDVTVRSRGVMEKCSLCIQRTQEVILKAKKEGKAIGKDGFKNVVACAAACNSGAMVFGDANDPESDIAAATASDRMYQLLAEIGTDPNVVYQTLVVN